MGAELITYILVGPSKLPRRKIRTAVAKIKRLLADEAFAFQDTRDESHEEVLEMFQAAYDSDPTKLVEDLFAAWNGEYRDSNSRFLNPEDPKDMTNVVVAGELSWGDPPDGAAYQAFTWASRFGLFEVFGIR